MNTVRNKLLVGFALVASLEVRAKDDCAFGGKPAFDDLDELTVYMQDGVDSSLPKHKQKFCSGKPRNVSRRITRNAEYTDTNFDDTFAFKNPPGPLKEGMCWLHSRLQRQFTYLANFRPDRPKPSEKEVTNIIDRIVSRKGVTEIPGFKNLYDFSKLYEKELTSAINTMGLKCTINVTDCAARLTDSYSPSPKEVRATMEKLYERQLHSFGDIQMIRSRIPEHKSSKATLKKPFVAHSLLILNMELMRSPKKPDEIMGQPMGYKMRVVDPNYPNSVETVEYKFGDDSFRAGQQKVIPYTHYEYDGDVPEMNKQLDEYCKK